MTLVNEFRSKRNVRRDFQGELDALVATLKQLENQKGEAMKRINDLKTQVSQCYYFFSCKSHRFFLPTSRMICDVVAMILFSGLFYYFAFSFPLWYVYFILQPVE